MNLRHATLLLALTAAALLRGQSLQLPVAAIFDARHLSAAEFRALHPGNPAPNGQPVELGWFVRYTHENLDYHFGPLTSQTAAEVYRAELADVVAEATKVRGTLSTAKIEVYENKVKPAPTPAPTPTPGKPSVTTPSRPSGSGTSAPPPAMTPPPVPTPKPAPPPPPPSESFWSKLKRIFGW